MAEEFLENIVDKYTNTPVLLYAVQGHRACTSLQSKKPTVLEVGVANDPKPAGAARIARQKRQDGMKN